MDAPTLVAETAVTDRYAVTIPAAIRSRLDIEQGDTLRWRLRNGELEVEVVRRRYGRYENLDPIETDEATDAVRETETGAYDLE